ncbi:glycosyl transferase [Mycoplana dimorpha]|uniref:Glycosyl transferase family 2 n=1 Tax=Mycoplana dimorpha TaxID=28320 RepID=A0A2T5BHS0_MYCDI|nr:glycosyl transferase [Mycoplana dimorpha]PTM98423.1 hypothetical protein C7449_10186 [Mycoplana dimorpha]
MLTVMLECNDDEAELAQTLAALVPAAVDGLVRDVVVLDHGSRDGSADVADAAGCRFLTDWDLPEVIAAARGEWLLLLEPGARPLNGWVEAVAEHVSTSKAAVRFSVARDHRRTFLQRLIGKGTVLEEGLLMPKGQAGATMRSGMGLEQLATAARPRRLVAEIVPAWAVRDKRQ